jgi:hypothetical protein
LPRRFSIGGEAQRGGAGAPDAFPPFFFGDHDMSLRNGHATNGTVNRVKAAPLSPVGNGDRDAKSGRFAPGNRCGGGNPVHRRLAQNRSLLLATVSADELRELFRDLYRRALAGDNDACRIILAYAVGKPREVVSEDDSDADELRRLDSAPGLSRIWSRLLECVSPEQALQLFRDALATKSGLGVRDLQPVDLGRVAQEMLAKVGK